jgi:hypothetical protein
MEEDLRMNISRYILLASMVLSNIFLILLIAT